MFVFCVARGYSAPYTAPIPLFTNVSKNLSTKIYSRAESVVVKSFIKYVHIHIRGCTKHSYKKYLFIICTKIYGYELYSQSQHLFPVIFRVVLFCIPQLMYDKGKIHYFIYLFGSVCILIIVANSHCTGT